MKPFRTKKRLFSLIFITLLLAIAVGSLHHEPAPTTWKEVLPEPEHTKIDESGPLREQTRVVEIAGRTFEIPIMYFDSALDPGQKQDALLLEVIWPEMRSTYELKDKAEYTQMWKHEKRLGWILLHQAATKSTLDNQVTNSRLGLTKEEYAGKENGLEKYLWYRGPSESPKIWAEAYFAKSSNGQITVKIECRLGLGVVVPWCSHKFIDGGLLYQISYSKAVFFSEWHEQQQRAIDFMHNLEANQ